MGHPLWIVDQLDFVVGALAFGAVLYVPSFDAIALILVATPAIHLGVNWIAWKLKLKNVPW